MKDNEIQSVLEYIKSFLIDVDNCHVILDGADVVIVPIFEGKKEREYYSEAVVKEMKKI